MTTNSGNNDNSFQTVISTLEKNLDFKKWDFEKEFVSVDFPPYVIYSSKKCLARFYWYQTRFYEEPMIYVSYGRLHAPFDKNIMLWNGQNCHCWHLINGILLFLDNRSPVDISMEDYVSPKILREFRETNISKSFPLGEYIAKEQAIIWEHYGNSFFDLFDLNQTTLWDEYSKFLKLYYEHSFQQAKLKGHSPIMSDLYKVC